jgi:DNA (cytosine-5)-methyltransferase 1
VLSDLDLASLEAATRSRDPMKWKSPTREDALPRRPVAIDVFSGAGGMSLGFERAGFDVLAAFDNDPVHAATYRFNFPLTATACVDVARLRASHVRAAAAEGAAKHKRPAVDMPIDCLFGGPSCQGFSEIGRMSGEDPRNSLVFDFARLVRNVRPRYFVMENVPGFASPRYAAMRGDLCRALRKAGYDLLNDGPILLDSSEYGVPQIRKRVFIVGARRGEQVPEKPVPSSAIVGARAAIGDLPDAAQFAELVTSDEVRLTDADRAGLPQPSRYVTALNRPRAGHYGFERRWDPNLLTCSGRTEHSRAVAKRLSRVAPGDVEVVSRLRRLHPDTPSYTLRAGTGRDHGSFTASRPVHYEHDRVITVREAARLHSFPDWFRFHATKWHGFRQVGNSVPPLFAEAIAATLLAAMDLEPRRPSGALPGGRLADLRFSLGQAADDFQIDRSELPRDVRRTHER